MRVVYSPVHLGHEIRTQTIYGVQVPASEISERAERIRATLAADGAFQLVEPTEHGEDPITAVHDPGLLAFLREAWPETRRAGITQDFMAPETIASFLAFEGMSDAVRREPAHIGGRSGYRALDTSTPIVPGTYAAARSAVDVALTTVDLVLGGEAAAYGLCRPPGHHAARSMYGGYCYFNNAAIAAEAIVRPRRASRRDPRPRLPPRQRHPADLLRRGDVLYVSLHADPDRPTRTSLGSPTRPARARGRAPTSTCRSRPA